MAGVTRVVGGRHDGEVILIVLGIKLQSGTSNLSHCDGRVLVVVW